MNPQNPQNPNKPKLNAAALVLLSGGMDSGTCLRLAREAFGASVVGVSVDYGQRHKKELQYAEAQCAYSGCRHMTIKAPEPPSSMLTDPSIEVPNISYDEITGVSPTYVPFRNGLLLSVIAGLAQDAEGCQAIYFGAHSEDAANWAYPDCTPEFIGAMANAIYIGTYRKVRLHTPLQWLMKSEIVELGHKVGTPWHLTWSCYKGGETHCGTCPTCISRREAFEKAGVKDPTIYGDMS